MTQTQRLLKTQEVGAPWVDTKNPYSWPFSSRYQDTNSKNEQVYQAVDWKRGGRCANEREIRAIEEILSLQKPPLTESEARDKWKGFVKKYKPPPSNQGQSRYSPNEFTEKVGPWSLEIMRDNCQTKVKMILSWMTVKDNEDGSTQLIDSHFHTEVARNLERLMKRKSSVNTILERLQTCNREGSNRRFQRVTSLKIHLNRYKPLGGLSYIKFLVRLPRRR